MAPASRDAKSCVSRAKNAATTAIIFTTLFYEFLLVRRKILRLYFGLYRRKCGCFPLTDEIRPDT